MSKFRKGLLSSLLFLAAFGCVTLGEPSQIAKAQSQSVGEYVYVGGIPLGITVGAEGLIYVGSSEVMTETGAVNPVCDVDIRKGDVIVEVDGNPSMSVYEFKQSVEKSKGDISLKIRRNSDYITVSVTPVMDKYTGVKKLGLILKEDIGGIGTLTFVTEQGQFAALGHHISDPESGLNKELQKGKIMNACVDDVVKGEKGKAGGLQANVNRLQTSIGNISNNTEIGIYGNYYEKPQGSRIRIADRGEAKMGKAQILTTIKGEMPKMYEIEIVKVVSQNQSGEKGLVLAVKDKELLDKAGGIVQGMSGSPIIQNGVLVGAVTHVFISDPTRGYGVHARFMYENALSVPMVQMDKIAA